MTEYTKKPTAQKLKLAAEAADKWLELTKLSWKLKKTNLGKVKSFFRETPLSPRQHRILMALEFTDMNTISQLALAMALNKSTLSITMSKMSENGLIETFEPEGCTDGRKTFFRASEKGREIINKQCLQHEEEFKQMYNILSYRQKNDFDKGAELLYQTIHREKDYMIGILESYISPNTDEKTKKILKSLAFFSFSIMERLTRTMGTIIKTNKNVDIQALTDHQLYLLFCIYELKQNTISSLENLTGASTSTLSIAVKRLAAKGLVKKSAATVGDGRVVYISITESTQQMIERLTEFIRMHLSNYFASEYTESEIKKIIRGIKYLCRVFEDGSLFEKMRFA